MGFQENFHVDFRLCGSSLGVDFIANSLCYITGYNSKKIGACVTKCTIVLLIVRTKGKLTQDRNADINYTF